MARRNMMNDFRGQQNATAAPPAAPASAARQPNRGGGGGHHNPGQNKGQMGLYGGKAGSFAVTGDPARYTKDLLGRAGQLTGSGNMYDEYQQNGFQTRLTNEYNAASALNQRLTYDKWLAQTYGASIGGKKGQNVQLGSLADAAQEGFKTANAEVDRPSRYALGLSQAGLGAGRGSQALQNFLTGEAWDRDQQDFRALQQVSPTSTYEQFAQTRDPRNELARYLSMTPSQRGVISPFEKSRIALWS